MDWSYILLVAAYVALVLNLTLWMVKYMRLKREYETAAYLIEAYESFLDELNDKLEAKDSDEK